MLNPLPNLLAYSFFAPTLLRIAAACVFFYLAYYHFQHKEQISRIRFFIVGEGAWIAWLAVLIEGIIGIALLVGYCTQIAAIIGAIGAFKHVAWSGRYQNFFILSRTAAFLLLVICVSLLASGAGQLAFDVRL
jgi:uncharacterized membrane protein YphA (DoxX/SURF4 family)